MTRAAVLMAFLAAPAAAQDHRLAASWPAMVEACLDYLETGQRAVFDGWHVAHPEGGVCNGDPACEGPYMTFIAGDPLGTGAVTVDVPGTAPVGDRPEEARCASAVGTRHHPAAVGAAQEALLDGALASGRLTREGGALHGCAWNGARFSVSFDLSRAVLATFAMRLPAEAGGGCGIPVADAAHATSGAPRPLAPAPERRLT